MKAPRTLAVILYLTSWCFAVPAQGSESIRKDLAGLAKELAQFLGRQGESTIAVGQFEGPATFPNSAGPGISMTLAHELRKLGVDVKTRARLGVRGQYRIGEIAAPDDPLTQLLAVRLQASVVDAFNNVHNDFKFECMIGGEGAVVELLGAVVELAPNAPPRLRDERIRKSLLEPRAAITDNRVAASPASLYAVEILVKGVPSAPRDDDGLAFIDLDRAEGFAVRVINNSDKEAAVRLFIDGLSLFAFSEHRQETGPSKGDPLYSVLLVPAGKSLIVKGWHRTNEESDPFQVTAYGKGVAAIPKQSVKVGTITATFAAAWPEAALPPADEAPAPRGTSHSSATSPPSEANFDVLRRKVGTLRAVVSVRYLK